jgi:hypothetical protein
MRRLVFYAVVALVAIVAAGSIAFVATSPAVVGTYLVAVCGTALVLVVLGRAAAGGATPGRRLLVVVAADVFLVALGLAVTVQLDSGPAWRYVLAALGFVAAGVAAFWWVPQWQASRWPNTLDAKSRIELEDKSRATIAQLLSGLGLLATVAITLYQVNQARVAADRTIGLSERTQASASFSKAIDQLGARNGKDRALEIRQGAIFALQQYAVQAGSPESRERLDALATVMTVLAGYIRTNSPADSASSDPLAEEPLPLPRGCATGDARPARRLAPDLETAVTVLVDLTGDYWVAGPGYVPVNVDLSRTDLRGADFSQATFPIGTSFEQSHLSGSAFSYANLEHARLDGADVRHACFYGANLGSSLFAAGTLFGAAICRREYQGLNAAGQEFLRPARRLNC